MLPSNPNVPSGAEGLKSLLNQNLNHGQRAWLASPYNCTSVDTGPDGSIIETGLADCGGVQATLCSKSRISKSRQVTSGELKSQMSLPIPVALLPVFVVQNKLSQAIDWGRCLWGPPCGHVLRLAAQRSLLHVFLVQPTYSGCPTSCISIHLHAAGHIFDDATTVAEAALFVHQPAMARVPRATTS